MIVEFVGLPGAGKSTLHRMVATELEARGYLVRYGGQGLWPSVTPVVPGLRRYSSHISAAVLMAHRIRTAVTCLPLLAIVVREFIGTNRSFFDFTTACRWLIFTVDEYRAAADVTTADSERTVVLFDEGIVQRCFVVFVHAQGSFDLRRIEAFADRLPISDLAILIEAPAVDAIGRLADRGRGLHPRFETLDDAALFRLLDRAVAMLRDVLERRPATDPFVSVRAPVERSAERVADLVDRMHT